MQGTLLPLGAGAPIIVMWAKADWIDDNNDLVGASA